MDGYINRGEAIEAVKHAWAKGIEPSQYIEREAAIKAIEKADYTLIANDADSCKADYLRDIIESVPATDVVPVRHGRWRYFHKQNIAVCTECSFERDLDANFGRAVNCPNCGAKMDGGNS